MRRERCVSDDNQGSQRSFKQRCNTLFRVTFLRLVEQQAHYNSRLRPDKELCKSHIETEYASARKTGDVCQTIMLSRTISSENRQRQSLNSQYQSPPQFRNYRRRPTERPTPRPWWQSRPPNDTLSSADTVLPALSMQPMLNVLRASKK